MVQQPVRGAVKVKFTDRQVLNLKCRPERYEVWEARGLGLRVSPTGRKTWIFLYRFHGRPRRMTLGHYPDLSVAEAHKKHAAHLVDVEKGIDPGAVAIETKRELRKAETIKDLVEDYIKLYAKPNKRSWRDDEWMLEREVVPLWGNRKAREITRRDVVRLLDAIVDGSRKVTAPTTARKHSPRKKRAPRPAPYLANRVFACVRKMFAWAVSRDMLPTSPCLYVPRPAPERTRDRVLTEEELTKLWRALQAAPATDRVHYVVQLVLCTGQRPGEVLGARWEEIDQEAGWWTIPAERSKNGKVHRVPITPLVDELLEAARALDPDSPWVVPSTRVAKKKYPLQESSPRRWIECFRAATGVEKFRPHDLRRTAATGMTELGVPRFIVGRLLNHSEGGDVTAIYDRNQYDKEKREALERWCDRLGNLSVFAGNAK